MKTMYHPASGRPVEVAESMVDSWAAQGWLKTKPKAVREAEAKKPADK